VTISELIKALERIKDKCGDLPVTCQTLSHSFAPEPTVVRNKGPRGYVLLNP
jgi:hypothetical protein